MDKYLTLIILLIMPHNSFAQQQISNFVTPVTYFVNHVKQLNLLKNNLTKYRQTSIVGTSGMGKTQLARMYCYENQNNYKLIWFVDCNLDINQELLKLAKAINSTAKSNLISEDMRLVRKELMSHLSNQDKWLLIFDNLKISENKKVQEFVDWEHNGHVIFCSQDSEILPNIVKMTAFEKSNAITLANNIIENNDAKLAEFLSEKFAGYPILIVQGAQLLNNVKDLDRKEYKDKIQQSTDKIQLNITLVINELKPSAKKLLNKIALINNQGFSKELLKIITDNQNTLDDDLYQLSKFALISNIDSHDTNPVFEMHDVIVQKIIEMNGVKINKPYLEDIVVKLIDATPKSGIKGRIFRTAKTISENFEIILKNSEKYKVNIYKILGLKLYLILQYLNSWDNYNAKKLVDWFNKNDQEGKFKLWLMNNDEKHIYARYIKFIGRYYKNCSNNQVAIEYYIRAKEVFDKVKDYETFKCNVFYALATSNIALGQIQEAKKNIQIMKQMFTSNLVDKSDIGFLHCVKSQLFLIQGKYPKALDQINQDITESIKQGLKPDDFFLTSRYMLKAEILNYLKKYQEARVVVEQLYDMHKSSKKEEHEIFGRIFIQMARSELGLGKLDHALEHVNRAITIFLADEHRNPKGADYSEDINLAVSYVVQGDVLFAQDNIKEAIKSYNKAYTICYYLYRDNRKNVAQVSELYSQGAKAACRAKDLHSYKFFGKQQVKEFGVNHTNTVSMFEYCKQHNMNLWEKK
ncbi:tetratricopeptide repeat protein [Candidatus Tisiphia endosymbiont of Xenochironomus xenolabis]|uniref:tetratricopeptide repeat protein n=1 Tax=Candidatus Tisiphia endosymbiont of Xenochironomus xenolabis TaxID=3139334 RepID=UPI0035C8ED8C